MNNVFGLRDYKNRNFQPLLLARFVFFISFILKITIAAAHDQGHPENNYIQDSTVQHVQQKLFEIHSSSEADRIVQGTSVVSSLWREADGSAEEFHDFCLTHYLGKEDRDKHLTTIIDHLKILSGHTSVIRSRFTASSRFADIDEATYDPLFRACIPSYDPWSAKLAFFIQLNFPYVDTQTKLAEGTDWDRRRWAEVRLGDRYAFRAPDDFDVPYSEEASDWNRYISNYFFNMGYLLPGGNASPFPEGLMLNCHHGLRDNIKEEYTREGGFERQVLSKRIIERILHGEVPLEFIENTDVYWDPLNQEVYRIEDGDLIPVDHTMEGLKRYEGFYYAVRNRQAEDSIHGEHSTVISRVFDNAQFAPGQVEQMIRDFLGSRQFRDAGLLVKERLGRDLCPFDIWYSGFQSQTRYPSNMLDSIVKARYPDAMALQDDLPAIYRRLGFSDDEADWLGNSIEVRAVVSGGYSGRPPLLGYKALITTAFGKDGLDYKGFRIAMHEVGHATEMLYTSKGVDYAILEGVPTAGITEGVAEYFAYRNMEALGLEDGASEEEKHLQALANLWYLVDMGGQALTEIKMWRWMYDNPDANPAEVKEAMLDLSGKVWNDYFAPVFGVEDQHILSIYNHMITGSYYLFNYFIGNVVMFQLYDDFTSAEVGLANACAEGRTLPDLWMQRAVGQDISIDPLLTAADDAIQYFNNQ